MCNRIVLSTVVFMLFIGSIFAKGPNQAHLDYIFKYKDLAIREMERASIPASITLAQGILESGAGTSWLAVEGNNHFGIKCGSDWFGATIYKKDDDRNAFGEIVLSCFRKYDSVEESYVAHSDFLHHPNKPWYKPLFELDITDYKGWAQGLLDAGYATNPKYPELLIGLIERYELFKYDGAVSGKPVLTPEREEEIVLYTNRVPYTIAKAGERLGTVAFRTGISARQLVKYNDGLEDGNQILEAGQIIYLKHKKWNNMDTESEYHIVLHGETMVDISQMYAVSLFWLNFKNRLKEGQQPAVGEKIKLRGNRVAEAPILANKKDIAGLEADNPDEDLIDWEIAPAVNPIKPEVVPLPVRNMDPEEPVAQPLPYVIYVVKKGDTLWRISQKYNITVEELKRMNNLTGNIISIGQELKIDQ
ncbi:MAG: LysM peptidoglycan-binding domain-containing protein [Bacteroidetes bacterium]|nr:MAG: LysM peptidoglycan-binding domain-containing protein [Bacteroidota bacterium]